MAEEQVENEEALRARASLLADFPPRPWHLLAAWLLIAGLYLACVSDMWTSASDSALYLGLGRSVQHGQGYQFNQEVNNHVPPGFSLILAAIGVPPQDSMGMGYFRVNLFIALTGLAGGFLMYKSLSLLDDRRMALAVLAGCMFCYTYVTYSHRVLSDMPFVAFFWGIFYCCLRCMRGSVAWLTGVVLLSAAGITVRLPGILMLGPLALAIAVEPMPAVPMRRKLLVGGTLLTTLLVVTGTWYALARLVPHQIPYAYSASKFPLQHLHHPITWLWTSMERFWGILLRVVSGFDVPAGFHIMSFVGIVVMIFMIVGMVRLWQRGKRIFTVVVVLSVAAFFFFHRPYPLDRYLMAVFPLIFYSALEGLLATVGWVYLRFGKVVAQPKVYLTVASFAIVVSVGFNLVQTWGDIAALTVKEKQESFEKRHQELAFMVNTLNSPKYRGSPVMAEEGIGRMCHYLSGHPLRLFPMAEHHTSGEAKALYREYTRHPETQLVILRTKGLEAFTKQALKSFGQTPGLKIIYQGKNQVYTVYDCSAASRTTTAPTSSESDSFIIEDNPGDDGDGG